MGHDLPSLLHSIFVQSNIYRLRTKALGKLPYSLNRYWVVDIAGAALSPLELGLF